MKKGNTPKGTLQKVSIIFEKRMNMRKSKSSMRKVMKEVKKKRKVHFSTRKILIR